MAKSGAAIPAIELIEKRADRKFAEHLYKKYLEVARGLIC